MVKGQLKNSQTTKRPISQTTKKIYEKVFFNFNNDAHSRFGRVGRCEWQLWYRRHLVLCRIHPNPYYFGLRGDDGL